MLPCPCPQTRRWFRSVFRGRSFESERKNWQGKAWTRCRGTRRMRSRGRQPCPVLLTYSPTSVRQICRRLCCQEFQRQMTFCCLCKIINQLKQFRKILFQFHSFFRYKKLFTLHSLLGSRQQYPKNSPLLACHCFVAVRLYCMHSKLNVAWFHSCTMNKINHKIQFRRWRIAKGAISYF